MRICHVNLASGFSGGENQTLQLIQQQLKLGYQLAVVANPKSPFFTHCRSLDVELHPCKQFLATHPRRLSKSHDIIHVHEGRAVYWALIQHLLYGTPYLITRRVDNPLKKKKLLNLAYRRAGSVIALSHAIKQAIQQCMPERTVEIIPSSPVRYETCEEAVEQLKQRYFQGEFHVIQAAKLYQHKGHDVSIAAAKILANSAPNCHLYILGDGPEEENLKMLASGLQNVHFVGKQSNMGAWFEAADLLIHPSYSEGLGSVILEAQAAELPVIGARAGGIPDIIQDGENGLLIEPGDARTLAQAIISIRDDQTLRDTLRKGAETSLKDFSIEVCAKRYEGLYQNLLP